MEKLVFGFMENGLGIGFMENGLAKKKVVRIEEWNGSELVFR